MQTVTGGLESAAPVREELAGRSPETDRSVTGRPPEPDVPASYPGWRGLKDKKRQSVSRRASEPVLGSNHLARPGVRSRRRVQNRLRSKAAARRPPMRPATIGDVNQASTRNRPQTGVTEAQVINPSAGESLSRPPHRPLAIAVSSKACGAANPDSSRRISGDPIAISYIYL